MSTRRTLLVTLACSIILWVMVNQLNHSLTSWAVTLHLSGLLVTFPALRLEHRDGWKCVFLLGLFIDSTAPVPFGLHAALFLATFTLIHHYRQRLAREENLVGIVVAILANVVIFASLTAVLIWRNPEPSRIIGRLLMESTFSAIVIAGIAPWYFAFQQHALERLGCISRPESRSLL